MSGDARRPDDPPPMSNPATMAAAFRRHNEESVHDYIQAASMHYRRLVQPYHYNVLSVATDFLNAGKPDIAVIMAQTACEIATDAVIHELLRRHNLPPNLNSWITDRVARHSTFHQEEFYKLYRALTGDAFKGRRLWQQYEPYIKIRNDILHKGHHATEPQAKRCCEIVLRIIRHLEATFDRVTAK